jgi:hypothetical protein
VELHIGSRFKKPFKPLKIINKLSAGLLIAVLTANVAVKVLHSPGKHVVCPTSRLAKNETLDGLGTSTWVENSILSTEQQHDLRGPTPLAPIIIFGLVFRAKAAEMGMSISRPKENILFATATGPSALPLAFSIIVPLVGIQPSTIKSVIKESNFRTEGGMEVELRDDLNPVIVIFEPV